MKELLLVCLGGGIGTGFRHLTSRLVPTSSWGGFPMGTLVVNVLGSFLLAVIAVSAMKSQKFPDIVVVMLTTGVMGGFTTYSTFNFETISLIQQGRTSTAAVNVIVTLTVCALSGLVGMLVGSKIAV